MNLKNWSIYWRTADIPNDTWHRIIVHCDRRHLLGYVVALQARLMNFYSRVEVTHD